MRYRYWYRIYIAAVFTPHLSTPLGLDRCIATKTTINLVLSTVNEQRERPAVRVEDNVALVPYASLHIVTRTPTIAAL